MTSYTPAPAPAPPRPTSANSPLIEGPQWYRGRIRSIGPLLGTLIPGFVGAVAYAALKFSDASWSGAVGLIGGILAAPGLLVAGAPFGDRGLYPLAIAASGLVWLLVGFGASRRATRNPMATWADYWRHYLWMASGIWVGAAIALGAATVSIGESLI